MSLSITCSNCQKKLNVKEELAGKKVRCPECSAAISVPAKSAAADNDYSEDRDEPATPRRKRRVVKEDDFDDMPALKPRASKSSKKKSGKGKSSGMRWLLLGGSFTVGLVVVLGVILGASKLIGKFNADREAKAARQAELLAAEKDRVQADVRSIYNALHAGDVDTILRFTNPKLVEMMGGKDQAKVQLAAPLEQIRSAGMTFESLDFPKDPTFFETPANQYVIVHTLSIAKLGDGQRVESVGYQLGVRPVGTTEWTYVDGKGIAKANAVTVIFPDFPKSQSLPPTSIKQL